MGWGFLEDPLDKPREVRANVQQRVLGANVSDSRSYRPNLQHCRPFEWAEADGTRRCSEDP